jgi:hypothetical protein
VRSPGRADDEPPPASNRRAYYFLHKRNTASPIVIEMPLCPHIPAIVLAKEEATTRYDCGNIDRMLVQVPSYRYDSNSWSGKPTSVNTSTTVNTNVFAASGEGVPVQQKPIDSPLPFGSAYVPNYLQADMDRYNIESSQN